MAVQYEVAFSASTMGIGVVAGGPYYCSGLLGLMGAASCMDGNGDATLSQTAAVTFAASQWIDPVANIAAAKVYLFSGTDDKTVAPPTMAATKSFYSLMGVPDSNLQYVSTFPAGHAFISASEGNDDCSATKTPYVNKCSAQSVLYNQPEAILTQIYGKLAPKGASVAAAPVPFDQTEFGALTAGMADTGFVYVPSACHGASAKCAVHVVFHGCEQAEDKVGDAVYGKLGYNEVADTNGIIVLYPQINSTVLPMSNPKGCWDWWGYTTPNYPLQNGAQMAAVRAMVKRLTAE